MAKVKTKRRGRKGEVIRTLLAREYPDGHLYVDYTGVPIVKRFGAKWEFISPGGRTIKVKLVRV